MKRILVICQYAVLNAIPYAIGYGLGELFGDALDLHGFITFAIAYAMLIVAGALGSKLLHWYEARHNVLDKKVFIFALLSYMLFDFLTDYVFGTGLFDSLLENLVEELAIGLATYGFSQLLLAVKRWHARNVFGTGDQSLVETLGARARVSKARHFAVNRQIKGDYDKALAAVCTTGTFVGEKHKDVLVFKGIPYAQPPVGPLRWKAPQPLPPSDAVFQAIHFSPIPAQPLSYIQALNDIPKSEDCLTLNIWTAAEANKRKRPVMVFLHGGDQVYMGSALAPLDGHPFVKQNPDTIFVTLNFRLGIFGILDLSAVPGGEDFPDSTDLPLLDQMAALRWLKENIAAFHGDPDNITLCGNDSGAVCAAILAVLPQARGLFRRAVLLSATNELFCSREAAREQTAHLMERLQVSTVDELLKIPQERLCQAQLELWMTISFFVLGKGLVPQDLLEAYRQGDANGIDIIAGTTENSTRDYAVELGRNAASEFYAQLIKETKHFLPEDRFDFCAQRYGLDKAEDSAFPGIEFFDYLFYHSFALSLCRAHAANGQSARYMQWRIASPIEAFGAFSNIEVPYILNTLQTVEQYGIIGDPRMGRIIQAALAKFMKNGNPSLHMDTVCHNDFLHWPPVTAENAPALIVEEDKMTIDRKKIDGESRPVEQLLLDYPALPSTLIQATGRFYHAILQELHDKCSLR